MSRYEESQSWLPNGPAGLVAGRHELVTLTLGLRQPGAVLLVRAKDGTVAGRQGSLGAVPGVRPSNRADVNEDVVKPHEDGHVGALTEK